MRHIVRISKQGTQTVSVRRASCRAPLASVAGEAPGAIFHALSRVDDEALGVGEVHAGAQFQRDAAPALEAVGARRAVRHAAALVKVVHTRGARHVAVRSCAAAQTLGVAALARVRARPAPATFRAHWRWREVGVGGPERERNIIIISFIVTLRFGNTT